jgi:hypothetical protein
MLPVVDGPILVKMKLEPEPEEVEGAESSIPPVQVNEPPWETVKSFLGDLDPISTALVSFVSGITALGTIAVIFRSALAFSRGRKDKISTTDDESKIYTQTGTIAPRVPPSRPLRHLPPIGPTIQPVESGSGPSGVAQSGLSRIRATLPTGRGPEFGPPETIRRSLRLRGPVAINAAPFCALPGCCRAYFAKPSSQPCHGTFS